MHIIIERERSFTHTHTRTHTQNKQTHTHTHTHNKQTHTHIHHTYKYAHTHTHTHTHTPHIHTCTCTHTHTTPQHTHTQGESTRDGHTHTHTHTKAGSFSHEEISSTKQGPVRVFAHAATPTCRDPRAYVNRRAYAIRLQRSSRSCCVFFPHGNGHRPERELFTGSCCCSAPRISDGDTRDDRP